MNHILNHRKFESEVSFGMIYVIWFMCLKKGIIVSVNMTTHDKY